MRSVRIFNEVTILCTVCGKYSQKAERDSLHTVKLFIFDPMKQNVSEHRAGKRHREKYIHSVVLNQKKQYHGKREESSRKRSTLGVPNYGNPEDDTTDRKHRGDTKPRSVVCFPEGRGKHLGKHQDNKTSRHSRNDKQKSFEIDQISNHIPLSGNISALFPIVFLTHIV